jgi:hypothetical protein
MLVARVPPTIGSMSARRARDEYSLEPNKTLGPSREYMLVSGCVDSADRVHFLVSREHGIP